MTATPKYVVGVRTLCEFSAKRGNLDLRFTPSPSAQDGVAGHRIVAARRGAGYEAERSVAADYKTLTVRGRVDGYDAGAHLLEEVKTHRGDLDRMPANHRELHWAQAKVYGALLCRELGLADIRIALVYFEIASQSESRFVETHSSAPLQAFFAAQCESFLAWSERELAHAAARDRSLAALRFPHGEFRRGQRHLAEDVYRATVHGRCLVAQAPTGIGKTIGTVFPLLKAWPGEALDKIFFLTAKGSGRRLGLDALARIGASATAPRLRTVELVARAKACEHPDKACHGESCPLAHGFYDRLPAAREAALDRDGVLEQAAIRTVALAHAVCPYYLGQELARWADVVIGDYNHYFDLNAILHGSTLANEWKVALLVDEAHNLLERARQMYSAELDRAALTALRRGVASPKRRDAASSAAQHGGPPSTTQSGSATTTQHGDATSTAQRGDATATTQRGGTTMTDQRTDATSATRRGRATSATQRDGTTSATQRGGAAEPIAKALDRLDRTWRELLREQPETYRVCTSVPASFATALQQAAAAIADHLADDPHDVDPALLEFYFDALKFLRLIELFDAHSLFDITRVATPSGGATARTRAVVCIRNVVPAPHLQPRFAAARTSVLFSATLTPMHFHRDTLGLPNDAAWLDVESPFAPEQLTVRIARSISTRYADRDRSLAPIVELIARQFDAAPGNYLAFFSSFEYLDKVVALLAARHPLLPIWQQSRSMTTAGRDAFLARFTDASRGIGFAVLGGSFGEAVDLPGKRLIGAFVATLGLPPLNPVNESVRRRIDATFGCGYEYTYLYPGLQKVVQAVGRVIRTETDTGTVHLIDDRFARADVRRLLPRWWRIEAAATPAPAPSSGVDAPPDAIAPQPMQVRFLPVRLAS